MYVSTYVRIYVLTFAADLGDTYVSLHYLPCTYVLVTYVCTYVCTHVTRAGQSRVYNLYTNTVTGCTLRQGHIYVCCRCFMKTQKPPKLQYLHQCLLQKTHLRRMQRSQSSGHREVVTCIQVWPSTVYNAAALSVVYCPYHMTKGGAYSARLMTSTV